VRLYAKARRMGGPGGGATPSLDSYSARFDSALLHLVLKLAAMLGVRPSFPVAKMRRLPLAAVVCHSCCTSLLYSMYVHLG
jgi:hypothetical protein